MNNTRHITIDDILMENERVIQLRGEINDALANHVVKQLLYLNSQSRVKPITLLISSPGGSILSGNQILNWINKIEAPVYGVVDGYAASMAAVIFSQCEKGHRYVMDFSEIMLHQASSGAEGNIQDMRVNLAHTERLNHSLLELLAKATNKSYGEIEIATIRDKWLTSEEAIDFGIADAYYVQPKHIDSSNIL